MGTQTVSEQIQIQPKVIKNNVTQFLSPIKPVVHLKVNCSNEIEAEFDNFMESFDALQEDEKYYIYFQNNIIDPTAAQLTEIVKRILPIIICSEKIMAGFTLNRYKLT